LLLHLDRLGLGNTGLYASTIFSLTFFLPPLSFALLFTVLPALVLKLPFKMFPVIADNFRIR
ncbi:hypothetical protein, partial [uncultured Oscillibacter sp.]|uniref:hypothetical protein n=1 Tax=uncultured Oscillibacter sp. TaxID=876091 RepID=UPI0025DB8DFE